VLQLLQPTSLRCIDLASSPAFSLQPQLQDSNFIFPEFARVWTGILSLSSSEFMRCSWEGGWGGTCARSLDIGWPSGVGHSCSCIRTEYGVQYQSQLDSDPGLGTTGILVHYYRSGDGSSPVPLPFPLPSRVRLLGRPIPSVQSPTRGC